MDEDRRITMNPMLLVHECIDDSDPRRGTSDNLGLEPELMVDWASIALTDREMMFKCVWYSLIIS